MTHTLHPDVKVLLRAYARDLDALSPSKSLDARIDALVAAPLENPRPRPDAARRGRMAEVSAPGSIARWALAACLATVAVALVIALGVFIGVRIERAAAPLASNAAAEPAWPPLDFALWPTDSVALKIPAEVSPRGTLVAVDGASKSGGARYWVDIVVSNDGTVRIENIVPAGPSPGEKHGVTTQNP